MVCNHDGHLQRLRLGGHSLGRKRLDLRLQPGVKGQLVAALRRVRHPHAVCQMRGKGGNRAAMVWDGFGLRGGGLIRIDQARTQRPVQHAAAGRFGPVRVPVRAAALGRLRDRHQQGRFRRRQTARLLAEIGQRGRAYPFKIATEGREVQVKPKDLVLRQTALQGQGHAHLAQLAGNLSGPAVFQQTGHLHGQGGPTRHHMSVPGRLHRRPQQ